MTDDVTVDVVIPYCDDRDRLRSILLALAAQVEVDGRPLRRTKVVVADDASHIEPDVDDVGIHVDVVRSDLAGYHPAVARNLGAAVGSGDVIVFLDGDTVPTPQYVVSLVEPIIYGVADLTTGHRRHADLSDLDPAAVASWVADPDGSRCLAEPGWLADGLERTDHLRSGSAQVYQYVISAVLAVRRGAFDDVGGFDERFDSYGGEDWEFASRIWNAGWDLLNVPEAVAFHDGPDIEGRPTDHRAKTIESLRVANWIPASRTRLPGVRYEVPDLDVTLHLATGDIRANSICVTSLLASMPGDFRLRLVGNGDEVEQLRHLIRDDRLIDGQAPVAAGTRCVVEVTGPVEFRSHALSTITAEVVDGAVARQIVEVGDFDVRAVSRRLERRAQRTTSVMRDDLLSPGGLVSPIGEERFADWARVQRGRL